MSWPECAEVTAVWRIAAGATCVAAIVGATLLWPVYKEKAMERKLVEAARMRAGQGDATAQYRLASMYYRGKGVPQDYPEALRWYRKAADQGDAKAQYGLAFM